jgi:hypothetical protein
MSAAAAENCLGLGGGGLKILKFFQPSAAATTQPRSLHLYSC